MSTLAVINCGQLVTLAGGPRVGPAMRELSVVRNGTLIVADGIVREAGGEDLLVRADRCETVVDAKGRVVTPGLIDAHTHLVFAGSRVGEFEQRAGGAGYQEIAAAGGGIKATVAATRAASEDQLVDQARKHVSWMLRNGTTTAEAKSGYGLTVEDELKILRVVRRLKEEGPLDLVATFLGAHAIPPGHERDAYRDLVIEEMIPRVTEENLAEYCDVFCEQGYFDNDSARRIMVAAKRAGLKLRMHVDQLTNGGGAQLAADLAAQTADHLEQTNAQGIAALKRAGVTPILVPGSVYALGLKKYPDVRAMIDAGLPVVLATDFNPGSSPTPSLPMVMSIACTQMKMTPSEVLAATTINAAHSLDREHDRGSLEPGKRADFVVWDCDDYRDLGYYFGVEQADLVYIGGQPAFRRISA